MTLCQPTTGAILHIKRLNHNMQIAVFGSGSGTNFQALLNARKRWKKPPFSIAAVFSDRESPILERAANEQIPTICHSFSAFMQKNGATNPKDYALRCLYEEEIIEKLDSLNTQIDLVLLAGYMRLLYEPLLNRFKNRIINVHPADLTVLNKEGKRRYTGANSVYEALLNGETQTRSTVHLVNEELDGGTILVSGPWVPYEGSFPITKESAEEHQERQKRRSDWPAVTEAVQLLSMNRMVIDAFGNVYLDNELMPAEGALM